MKAIPEPRGTRTQVLRNIAFDIALLTPLSPLTPFPLPWEAISSGILQVFWLLRHPVPSSERWNGQIVKAFISFALM